MGTYMQHLFSTRPRTARTRWISALTAALALAGCGGGGSGGGGGTPVSPSGGVVRPDEGTPVAASALAAQAVEATGSTTLLQTLAAAVALPLYPLRTTAVAEGVRSQATDGSITVTYSTAAGPRSMTFLPSDVTSSDPGGFVAERGTATLYSEFWADPALNWQLDYSRLGVFFFSDQGTPKVTLLYFGTETPAASMPVSSAPNLGVAQYDGKTSGYIFGNTPGTLTGDVRLLVNFARDEFGGVITNLVTDASGTDQPLGVSFLVDALADDAKVTREAVGGSIKGTLAAIRDSDSTRISTGGTLVGRFFGPAADELSGGWIYEVDDPANAGNDIAIRAVFGTVRDTTANLDPAAVTAAGSTARVGAATGTLFPMYALEAVDGTRTQTAGGLALTFSDGGFPRPLAFQAGDIQSAGGITTATSTEATWHEFTDVDSVNGALAYARFAHLSVPDATAPTDRFHTFGYETPPANVPTIGRAEYYGQAVGRLAAGPSVDALTGLVQLQVDFDENAVTGKISALRATDSANQTRAIGSIVIIEGEIGENNAIGAHFVATLNPSSDDGRMTGRFYGPGVEEVAGAWNVALPEGLAEGVFGARSAAASHPSGAPRLAPWGASAGEAFVLHETMVRADYASVSTAPVMTAVSGSPGFGPSSLTVLADGGLRLDTTVDGGAVQGELVGDAFDTRSASFAAAQPVMQTYGHADETPYAIELGGPGYLSYARFGYWEDRSAGLLEQYRGFFYAGRETPVAEVPAQGTATYVGATIGQGLGAQGLARLHGALSLDVDFATNAVTGSLSGIVATYLAPTNASTTFDFSSVDITATRAPGTSTFSGTTAAQPGAGGTATGTVQGGFFGPQALEVGGTWNVDNGTVKAWGSFGGTR